MTDSCAEMPSSPSLLPVMPRAQETVYSACGLRGPPAHTPAQGKPQKGNKYEHDPFWPMRVRKVRSPASEGTQIPLRSWHAFSLSCLDKIIF